jgi:hypothetical protein
MLQGITDV